MLYTSNSRKFSPLGQTHTFATLYWCIIVLSMRVLFLYSQLIEFFGVLADESSAPLPSVFWVLCTNISGYSLGLSCQLTVVSAHLKIFLDFWQHHIPHWASHFYSSLMQRSHPSSGTRLWRVATPIMTQYPPVCLYPFYWLKLSLRTRGAERADEMKWSLTQKDGSSGLFMKTSVLTDVILLLCYNIIPMLSTCAVIVPWLRSLHRDGVAVGRSLRICARVPWIKAEHRNVLCITKVQPYVNQWSATNYKYKHAYIWRFNTC